MVESCVLPLSDTAICHRHVLRGLTLASVVSPELNDRFKSLSLGPAFAMASQAAEALIAYRDQGDLGAASKLPGYEPNRFRIFLVPRLLAELALAATAGGNSEAESLCASLANQYRDVLISGSQATSKSVMNISLELLTRIPAHPREALEIRVFVGLELSRHGRVLEDPVLRRRRVRDLLHLLVESSPVRREWLANVIWPDLDGGAGSNNLRVTLSHVLRLMEPDRLTGAPSFYIRSARSNEELTLIRGDRIRIDADSFEREVEAAEEADLAGNAGKELECLESAVSIYAGDYLIDAREPDWGAHHRTRLRTSFVRSATRAAALHLGQGDLDQSLRLAERAMALDSLAENAYRAQAIAYMRRSDHRAARDTLASCIATLENEGLPLSDETLPLANRLGVSHES